MKPNKGVQYGWGYILADCILLLDAIIDVIEGETTLEEILMLILLSVLSVCLIIAWVKRKKKSY